MSTRIAPILLAFLLPIGAANALAPPEMQEGLWAILTHATENPGNRHTDHRSTICRSHAYDEYALSVAKSVNGCSTLNESLQDNTYSVETRCIIGATTVESKGVTTFESAALAHSETHGTYTPPLSGISELTIVLDQKYQGPCPEGMQPGDMTHQDGTVTHLWKH